MKESRWLHRVFGTLGGLGMRLLRWRPLAHLIVAIPPFHRWVNKLAINSIVGQARFRPHPYSTKTPYTSWSSLTDKSWSGRHLGISTIDQSRLPPPDSLTGVFKRPDGKQRMCPKSTCLFPTFAQYLTDGFLRTRAEMDPDTGISDPNNRKRNTSNHEIDMCTLYGRTPEQTQVLRVNNPDSNQRGMLRSQRIQGEEYPPFLFKNGQLDPDFQKLDRPVGLLRILDLCDSEEPNIATGAKKMRDAVFAVGGDRVNSVPQVSMMNTLWLREHNRLARELGRRHRDWDDDQVFETARNIVIVQFIKIVVEDYINHISPVALPLKADPSVAWKAPWNKPNWITTEFSLLYRWHALIPDIIAWGSKSYEMGPAYFLNNLPLLSVGLKRGFEDMSAQNAAELGPRNTTEHLLRVETDSIRQGRICELASYNDYREYLGRDRVSRFEDISSDPEVAKRLAEAYKGDVNNVDFFVGIFCEDRVANSPLPQTILSFVGVDAFSQALPNPLLSEHVFTALDEQGEHAAFTEYGWEQIGKCSSLRDILERNIEDPEALGFVSMTQEKWKRE